MVEFLLPKQAVAGSNPVARSTPHKEAGSVPRWTPILFSNAAPEVCYPEVTRRRLAADGSGIVSQDKEAWEREHVRSSP